MRSSDGAELAAPGKQTSRRAGALGDLSISRTARRIKLDEVGPAYPVFNIPADRLNPAART
jgi:hypothetical protein